MFCGKSAHLYPKGHDFVIMLMFSWNTFVKHNS